MNLEKYANEQLANSSSSFAIVDVSSTSSSSNNTTTKTTETDYMTLKRNSDTMVDRYGIAEEFWHAMIRWFDARDEYFQDVALYFQNKRFQHNKTRAIITK